ncbi:MAG: exo-alpha-sialidase [Actinomycetota bacterium]|nr:exo-alpha-sialidase [Actinomycetota bacterium]
MVGLPLVWLAIAGVGCGETGQSEGLPSELAPNDPGPIHVHGLGVNPADGALFIATHTGLFRAPEGVSESERVADRYQDTMGFTIVGPDRFLGSGHPDGTEDLPPFLGLISSADAGETWDPISLQGEVDFHVLESSGDLVYGYGSDFKTREQQLLVSADGGETWNKRPLPEKASEPLTEESVLAMAIDPEDPSTVVASGQEALWLSTDQGRRWTFLSADTGLLAWAEARSLFLVARDGEVRSSEDGGRTWSVQGSIGGEPAALEVHDNTLYAALHDGTIRQSTDGGANWTVRSAP